GGGGEPPPPPPPPHAFRAAAVKPVATKRRVGFEGIGLSRWSVIAFDPIRPRWEAGSRYRIDWIWRIGRSRTRFWGKSVGVAQNHLFAAALARWPASLAIIAP